MKLLLILSIAFNSAFCICQSAEFSFVKEYKKFDKVKEGSILSHYYVFKNTGKAPLLIDSYEVACHCTKVDYPKHPILPGKIDSIKLTFDTKGKKGIQDREILILANTKHKETYLRFRVKVVSK